MEVSCRKRRERKVLRRIYGAGRDGADGEYVETRIIGEVDIVTDMKRNIIRWAGYVQRMTDNLGMKRVLIEIQVAEGEEGDS